MRDNDHIAYECLECKQVSVFPNGQGEGSGCLYCGGHKRAMGAIRVYVRPKDNKATNSIKINVEVGTKELDVALEKARELCRLMSNM